MTRETKIGLLVGLAFIIVIGILLSDHLTSSTEPPPAALTSAAGTVRGAIASPGATSYPPVANVTAPSVTPQQTVPTASDLKPPVQIVAIGPSNTTPQSTSAQQPANDPRVTIGPAESANTQQPTATADLSAQSATSAPAQQTTSQPPANAVVSSTVAPSATPTDQDLASIAASHGEPLVTPDGKPLSAGRFGSPADSTSARQYVAQDGDSLSKMAGRFLGSNTKTNRDAIVRLNPSLKANPDMIIVGKAYRIPTATTSATAQQPAPAPTEPAATVAARTPTNEAPAPSNPHADVWYTVKANDSLWRIANDELGSASEIDAIKELNKNALKGDNHDVIYVGMRLKLPAKPLAQAN